MSKELATLGQMDEVLLTPFRSNIIDWIANPAEVADFIETISRGGSILTYAKRRGLSFPALMLFLDTEAGGKIRDLVEMSRIEANASRAADQLRRMSNDGLGMTESQKRAIDAHIALAKFTNERKAKQPTANVNVKVSVSMSNLHGRIQERRRMSSVTIDSTAVDVTPEDDEDDI